MKSIVFLAFFLSSLLLYIYPVTIHAHPGRTDANGGHTCRTNCEHWGLDYGEYHYHGGGSSMESTNAAPVRETSQPEFSQKFMDYRNAVLTGTPTPTITVAPSPTTIHAPTPRPTQNVRPVQANVQAPPQPGFFGCDRSIPKNV